MSENSKQSNVKNGVAVEKQINLKSLSFSGAKRRNFGDIYTKSDIYNKDQQTIYNIGAERDQSAEQNDINI